MIGSLTRKATFLRIATCLCVALLTLPSPRAFAESEDGLSFGVAAKDITPEEGLFHDPLLAKTMYFRQGEAEAVLIICDLIAVSPELTAEVRNGAQMRYGIPRNHLAICASHTHTGRRAHSDLASRLTEAIGEAKRDSHPVRLSAATVRQAETISFNRRFLMKDGTIRFNPGFLNPDIVRPVGPIDPDVGILLFRDAKTNRPISSLTNFSLHLDTVGVKTHYSADYPYHMAESLKAELGDEFLSVFGTGPCGDVNHFDVSRPRAGSTANRGQTMLTPYQPKPTDASPSPLCAEYIGKALAKTVANAIPSLQRKTPSLAVRSETFQAPLATYSEMDLDWARASRGTSMAFLMRVRASRILGLESLRKKYGETMPVQVQVFRLSADTAIVTLPGEVFVGHSFAIKKASPFKNTLVIELANSNDMHYVPTRKAFCEAGYEVVNSRLESGAGEMMVDTALRLMKTL
jgi:hypothetical protein